MECRLFSNRLCCRNDIAHMPRSLKRHCSLSAPLLRVRRLQDLDCGQRGTVRPRPHCLGAPSVLRLTQYGPIMVLPVPTPRRHLETFSNPQCMSEGTPHAKPLGGIHHVELTFVQLVRLQGAKVRQEVVEPDERYINPLEAGQESSPTTCSISSLSRPTSPYAILV